MASYGPQRLLDGLDARRASITREGARTVTKYGVSAGVRGAEEVAMYSRTTGGGLLGLAVVLIVIGAIMRFAVTVTSSGFNIHKVGDILFVVGIILAIVSIALVVMGSRRSTTTRTDIRATPDGEQRVRERQDWGGGGPY